MLGSGATSQPFEELAGGGLGGPQERAWALFEAAWPEIIGRLEVFLRARRVPAELAEDCGQAVLVRVWRFRSSYRGSTAAELAAWMYRITENEAARALASGNREAQRREPVEPGAPLEELAETRSSAQDEVEARDAQRALDECLGGLEDQQREVIELLYAAEPSSERELVGVLGISKSYVNVLRQKALDRLARCLEKKGVA